MTLNEEQRQALQILADATRVAKLGEDGDFMGLLQAIPTIMRVCPKRFQRALNLGKMLVETGVLVPEGHGAQIVFDAMKLVAERREFFEAAFEATKHCTGCEDET